MIDRAQTVGILAYGSLIDEPGEEVAGATIRTTANVLTPFSIEFARQSRSRGGAPTLVPVAQGGSAVQGRVFVLDVPEDEATNLLWRRESARSAAPAPMWRPNTSAPIPWS